MKVEGWEYWGGITKYGPKYNPCAYLACAVRDPGATQCECPQAATSQVSPAGGILVLKTCNPRVGVARGVSLRRKLSHDTDGRQCLEGVTTSALPQDKSAPSPEGEGRGGSQLAGSQPPASSSSGTRISSRRRRLHRVRGGGWFGEEVGHLSLFRQQLFSTPEAVRKGPGHNFFSGGGGRQEPPRALSRGTALPDPERGAGAASGARDADGAQPTAPFGPSMAGFVSSLFCSHRMYQFPPSQFLSGGGAFPT